MNILRFSLEYQCFPIWEYTPSGKLIDNDSPETLRNDKELNDLLCQIQKIWDSNYVDTPTEFYGKGFNSDKDLSDFVNLIKKAENLIRSRYGAKYIVENNYTVESLKRED